MSRYSSQAIPGGGLPAPRRSIQTLSAYLLWLLLAAACLGDSAYCQLLQVTYGAKGVQTIRYNSAVFEDMAVFPSDKFYIGHLQCNDLQGNLITTKSCSWGEFNNGEAWDPVTHTETYTFPWGSIATQFVQTGDTLNLVVTETNLVSSGLVFGGAQLWPFLLHFPQDPVNFFGYSQDLFTTTGPAVSAADFGTGVVTSVLPDEADPLYGGWIVKGTATYAPMVANVRPDNLAPFFPTFNRPVQPGTSFTFTVSLRFTAEGTPANAQDAYAAFAAAYPSLMTWNDHRIIGSDYLASSPQGGDPSQPGGFPTNPRRYFNDSTIDVTTPAGLKSFQGRVLAQAAANVTNARLLNAQGVMVFDIEGEDYPQPTTYVCSPDQIASVAPEMESVITDPSSPYNGQKLDDAYFRTLTSAGLKVGVCIRPQVFTVAPNGTASQVYLSTNAAIIANLENKARTANARWGATMFYVDSNVDTYGGTLDPAIYKQLITDFPNFLFIPEESTPRYFAYTAPFYTFIFLTQLGTPASTYNFYPNAFGVNRVNDVNSATLAQYEPQLIQQVAHGDILLGHTEYWQANNPTLLDIYAAAKNLGSTPALPALTWPTPAAITYGAALSSTQLDATANTAGTFTYTPAAGQVLPAGTQNLSVVFVPADTKNYTNAMASVPLTVRKATPVITWSTPAPINQGTALSATQLNASADVPGTFAYSPSSGTVPAAGSATLSVTFTATDARDYSTAATSVTLTVNSNTSQGPVVILSPASGATVSGQILVTAEIKANLDAAGSFLMVDGNPAGMNRVFNAPFLYSLDTTTLSNGVHTLQVWAHDINNNTLLSPAVSITVGNGGGGPTAAALTWPAPAAITYGTPLSAGQLNANANVSGTFAYSPSAGALLNAGSYTLQVTFTPSDTTKYHPVTASVPLSVSKAIPVITWPTPAPVSQGTGLSSAQLDATANVSGTFTYTPPAGTVPAVGTVPLAVTFTPADLTNHTTAGATVNLTVNNGSAPAGPVVILSPAAGATLSGDVVITAQVAVPLDAAGSFLEVDGIPVDGTRTTSAPYAYPLKTTAISNGVHLLQIWAHDISNNTTISPPVTITVQN